MMKKETIAEDPQKDLIEKLEKKKPSQKSQMQVRLESTLSQITSVIDKKQKKINFVYM